MTDQVRGGCLSCGRTEAEIPLATWRYQGRELRICSDCMPVLIHERDKLLAKWRSEDVQPSVAGEDHAQR